MTGPTAFGEAERDDFDPATAELTETDVDLGRLNAAEWDERYAELAKAEADEIRYREFLTDPDAYVPF